MTAFTCSIHKNATFYGWKHHFDVRIHKIGLFYGEAFLRVFKSEESTSELLNLQILSEEP